jgi:hypothetical protein
VPREGGFMNKEMRELISELKKYCKKHGRGAQTRLAKSLNTTPSNLRQVFDYKYGLTGEQVLLAQRVLQCERNTGISHSTPAGCDRATF